MPRLIEGTGAFLKKKRDIIDGEFVQASVANRPSTDTELNVKIATKAVGLMSGDPRFGEWVPGKKYFQGDVVSYGGFFYVSLENNNTDMPSSSTGDNMNKWNIVGESNGIVGRSILRDETGILEGEVDLGSVEFDESMGLQKDPQKQENGYHNLSTGKYMSKYKTSRTAEILTLLQLSVYTPFKYSYEIVTDEAIINFDVIYLADNMPPKIFLRECLSIKPYQDFGVTRKGILQGDLYGIYGVAIKAEIRDDYTASISLMVGKYGNTISVYSDCEMEPLWFNTGAGVIRSEITYVRPYGGYNAQNVGALFAFDTEISYKTAWDNGLLPRRYECVVNRSKFYMYKGPELLKGLSDRVLRGEGPLARGLGGLQEDGVPNIRGQIWHIAETYGVSGIPSGVFTKEGTMSSFTPRSTDSSQGGAICLNANRVSSVYNDNITEARVKSAIVDFYTRMF